MTRPLTRRAFRRGFARWWLFGCAALTTLMGLSQFSPDLAQPLPMKAVYGSLAVVSCWCAIHVVRSGIFIDEDTVILRNFVRVYRIPWNEIEAFDPPTPYGTMRHSGLRVRKHDGTFVASSPFAAGPFTRTGFADEVLESLRDALEQHQGTPSRESA